MPIVVNNDCDCTTAEHPAAAAAGWLAPHPVTDSSVRIPVGLGRITDAIRLCQLAQVD